MLQQAAISFVLLTLRKRGKKRFADIPQLKRFISRKYDVKLRLQGVLFYDLRLVRVTLLRHTVPITARPVVFFILFFKFLSQVVIKQSWKMFSESSVPPCYRFFCKEKCSVRPCDLLFSPIAQLCCLFRTWT